MTSSSRNCVSVQSVGLYRFVQFNATQIKYKQPFKPKTACITYGTDNITYFTRGCDNLRQWFSLWAYSLKAEHPAHNWIDWNSNFHKPTIRRVTSKEKNIRQADEITCFSGL